MGWLASGSSKPADQARADADNVMNPTPPAWGQGPSSGNERQGHSDDNAGWGTGETSRYDPNPANYAWRGGLPPGYDDRVTAAGQTPEGNAANVAAARGLQSSGRGGLLGALQQMQNRPLDSDRLGQLMMQRGQEAVANNAASQLASSPGRFNPAAQRAAQMGASSAGQSMALGAHQASLASAIQERAAREATMMKGFQGLDENDIRRLMAESDIRKTDFGQWANQQSLMQGWQQMGLSEKAMEAASRQAYERAKMGGYMGEMVPGGAEMQMLAAGMQSLPQLISLAG